NKRKMNHLSIDFVFMNLVNLVNMNPESMNLEDMNPENMILENMSPENIILEDMNLENSLENINLRDMNHGVMRK
ncbi:6048_t:CDS:1, partial [Dentiscutata heterogama]